MFSWWSSLGPEEAQKREGKSEKSSEGGNETKFGTKGENDGKPSSDEIVEEKSKTSEIDYAKDMAKNVGSFLFNFASVATNTAFKVKDSVKETMENQSIIGDFNKKQEEFLRDRHKRKEAAVPPWVGYNEEDAMKNQILALSTDERNFLRDPPAGVPFHYESDSMFPVALATLQEDENLSKMRFQLVPKKISEERFWRNYFYRVSLIKQSTQLTSLAAAGGNGGNGGERQTSVSEAKTDSESSQNKSVNINRSTAEAPVTQEEDFSEPIADESSMHGEFISDSFAHPEQELSHDDLKQIGVEKKPEASQSSQPKPKEDTTTDENQDDIPEWEKELQAELQDFEVVDNEESAEWEKEIEDLLEEENDG
ncbi:synapse-associated protein 1-like [Montipora capricornis]|uniref:synapse-associated protein 1-like n=1 Tax=Montipora capricornis TaxID=246305 RepID=UPI0035F15B3C